MPRSVSTVACAELPVPICLFLLQISTLHGFHGLVVTLKPSGQPVLISHAKKGLSILQRTFRDTERHSFLILFGIIQTKGFLLIQWHLSASQPLFWHSIRLKWRSRNILLFILHSGVHQGKKEASIALCSEPFQMSVASSWTVKYIFCDFLFYFTEMGASFPFVLMLIIQFLLQLSKTNYKHKTHQVQVQDSMFQYQLPVWSCVDF